MRIVLKMDYCSTCGNCCLDYCKNRKFDGEDCKRPYDKFKEVCNRFPISENKTGFILAPCKEVNNLPIKTLEDIIKRLNNKEEDFEVKENGLYFKALDADS